MLVPGCPAKHRMSSMKAASGKPCRVPALPALRLAACLAALPPCRGHRGCADGHGARPSTCRLQLGDDYAACAPSFPKFAVSKSSHSTTLTLKVRLGCWWAISGILARMSAVLWPQASSSSMRLPAGLPQNEGEIAGCGRALDAAEATSRSQHACERLGVRSLLSRRSSSIPAEPGATVCSGRQWMGGSQSVVQNPSRLMGSPERLDGRFRRPRR